MTETKTIEIPVYRDKDGKPICGKISENYCTFSTWYDGFQCFFDDWESDYNHITPHKNCPLWTRS